MPTWRWNEVKGDGSCHTRNDAAQCHDIKVYFATAARTKWSSMRKFMHIHISCRFSSSQTTNLGGNIAFCSYIVCMASPLLSKDKQANIQTRR